jgi:hypothetical protein
MTISVYNKTTMNPGVSTSAHKQQAAVEVPAAGADKADTTSKSLWSWTKKERFSSLATWALSTNDQLSGPVGV